MNETVQNFYLKNPEENYIDQYERDHSSRLDAFVERFQLKRLKDAHLLDIGGGLGFLGKRLDSSNDYWVIDGAMVPPEKRLCPMTCHNADLDHDDFSILKILRSRNGMETENVFDAAFCLETLEHLSNPYHCLVEIKKLVKLNGDIYISIPTETVWHNTVYPGLLWPRQNFEQFLGQMALPVEEYWLWDKGWNAYHYRCRNAVWEESRMLFPKSEVKFQGKTPLEYTNL
jgi:SAM-dependent methyltransferase